MNNKKILILVGIIIAGLLFMLFWSMLQPKTTQPTQSPIETQTPEATATESKPAVPLTAEAIIDELQDPLAQKIRDFQFPGNLVTSLPEPLYPLAKDRADQLQLSVAEMDRRSFAGENPDLDHYRIELQYDPESFQASLKTVIDFKNTSGYTWEDLYFHIYPNAFTDEDIYPSMDPSVPFKIGAFEVKNFSLTKDGRDIPVTTEIEGDTQTVFHVKPELEVTNGMQLQASFEITLTLPEGQERLGQLNGFHNFGNFFPILAVFDQNGWNTDPYYVNADPFYSDIADYTVQVKVPDKYLVAASGKLLSKQAENGLTQWNFKSTNMRNFNLAISDQWILVESDLGDLKILSYVLDEEVAKPYIDAAISTISAMNEYLGAYPYPTFSFVESEQMSAMEWPGLIVVPTWSIQEGGANAWGLTASSHEVIHQYFFGLVGDDQIDEAWLDEGFATYMQYVYEPRSGYFNLKKDYKRAMDTIRPFLIRKDYQGTIVKNAGLFTDKDSYWMVYDAGALFLTKLRLELGQDVMNKVLKTYFTEYKYEIATTDDFLKTVEEVSGKDIEAFALKYLKFQMAP